VRASCPLDMYLITPGSAVIKSVEYQKVTTINSSYLFFLLLME
jgi:hypothetical protein